MPSLRFNTPPSPTWTSPYPPGARSVVAEAATVMPCPPGEKSGHDGKSRVTHALCCGSMQSKGVGPQVRGKTRGLPLKVLTKTSATSWFDFSHAVSETTCVPSDMNTL